MGWPPCVGACHVMDGSEWNTVYHNVDLPRMHYLISFSHRVRNSLHLHFRIETTPPKSSANEARQLERRYVDRLETMFLGHPGRGT